MPEQDEQIVYIVDDDSIVVDSLELLLRSFGFKTTSFTSPRVFLEQFQPELKGCLLLDITMPEMNGLDLQSRLMDIGSDLPIIFLTGTADIPSTIRALKKGAFHFLEKPYDDSELVVILHQALQHGRELAESKKIRSQIVGRLGSLTPREMEVLDLMVDGHSNRSIATELGISQRTIEIYRANVMQKMHTKSLASLVNMINMINRNTSVPAV